MYRVQSWDALGHAQSPSVLKLGPRALIGKERASFERVELILGNDAPSVRGFVDLGERAGLKYAYASMGRGEVRTFKALYASAPQETINAVLHEVFGEILSDLHARRNTSGWTSSTTTRSRRASRTACARRSPPSSATWLRPSLA